MLSEELKKEAIKIAFNRNGFIEAEPVLNVL